MSEQPGEKHIEVRNYTRGELKYLTKDQYVTLDLVSVPGPVIITVSPAVRKRGAR